ncbi:hypothetical protein JOE11_003330 [Robbsia andropogonis]
MIRKIALLGFVSGFALFLYGRKWVSTLDANHSARQLP